MDEQTNWFKYLLNYLLEQMESIMKMKIRGCRKLLSMVLRCLPNYKLLSLELEALLL